MDILDIDEMLKDDSFHFLEEKNPDDVSNIIQQWKNQNYMQQQQQHYDVQQQQGQQQQHNETYKIDSKTFTRPRRSAAQKLEKLFSNTGNGSECQLLQQQQRQQELQVPEKTQRQPTTPVLNVHIGGKVRTPLSVRSMLQDTSPPSSICSMDTLQDSYNMNNSLITSADFTHLNFLLSTPSLETSFNFNGQNCDLMDANRCTVGYTLGDMIRDRKALESLTLSADDGTFIKDSQISQIDDISLSMLKSSSGCNSMVNSAESVECNLNRTMQISSNSASNSYRNQTLTKSNVDSDVGAKDALQCTTVIENNDLVGDSTFTMLQNGQSFIISRQIKNETQRPNKNEDQQAEFAEIFSELKLKGMNETVCLGKVDEPEAAVVSNETFECQEMQDDSRKLQHTPEDTGNYKKMYESTPHTTRVRCGGNKISYRPAIRKIAEDPNLSPIVAIESNQRLTLDSPKTTKAPATFCQTPLSRYENMELLDNIENPNKTFNSRNRQQQQDLNKEREQRNNEIELQDIMDLAQAEAEILGTANGDEEQFEHMLDEFSRIKLNAEQLKMQKSLDKIKRRFNCNVNQVESETHITTSSSEYGSGLSNTFTSETKQETLQKLRDTFRNDTTVEISGTRSNLSDIGFGASGSGSGSSFILPSMAASGSSSGERLLSRRSRLNDDLSFSPNKTSSKCASGTNALAIAPNYSSDKENSTENNAMQKEDDVKHSMHSTENSETVKYKLAEQRERDRDRFKTIKIIRNRNDENESATQTVLNVPCIDDDNDNQYDAVNEKMESQNKNESVSHEKESCQNDTQKKPSASSQRISRSDLDSSEKNDNTITISRQSALKPPEARSLSRPRYISGLQKFSVVSKAVSAGDLEENITNAAPNETKKSQLNKIFDARRTQASGNVGSSKPTSNLKSPMGIKAKSLHNLAYNNQIPSTSAAANSQSRIGTFGLSKINSGGFGFEQQRMQKSPQQQPTQMKQKPFDGFKKPHAVSGLQTTIARTNRATAGIARPSSGYYSLNGTTKMDSFQVATNQASDRSTQLSTVSATRNIATTAADELNASKAAPNTGILKPSGIRPPNKRSGLPRPSSIRR